MEQQKIDVISQLISSMEQSVIKLEKSFENKEKENIEIEKRAILELQKELSEELE